MESRQWRKSATFFESAQHAVDGLRILFRQARNTRIILVVFGLAILAAVALQLPAWQLAVVAFVSAVVLAAEMFNTALELSLDLLAPEYQESVRVAKDLAAGAVLVLCWAAIVVGFVLFTPPLLQVFFE